MKRLVYKTTIISIFMFLIVNNTYAISENFEFVINTIGIPRYNVYGQEINEDIYYAYNIMSYDVPESLEGGFGQRWKDSKYGLWARYSGRYVGNGTRGEYNLLGRSYSGSIINNYYFPVDTLPTETPEYWNYYDNPGAEESWRNRSNYRYIEQLEFMKTTKLLFNDISSKDNSDNPDKIKEYNITANMIGLNKARLDTCSTWKTNGVIHIRRKVGTSIRYAVFLTKPMAAGANIKADIEVEKQDYVIKADQDKIDILIKHSAKIENMTNYAKEAHIKEIKTRLSVNGNNKSEVKRNKASISESSYLLVIERSNLKENQMNKINITNDCYAHTEFAVDGLMRDKKELVINVMVEEKKEEDKFQVEDIRIVEKVNDELVVMPIVKTEATNVAGSLGMTEAGKYLAVKIYKDAYHSMEDIKINFSNTYITEMQGFESQDKSNAIMVFKIPIKTNTSIYGWKSLRDTSGNYFNKADEKLGQRLRGPHKLTINYERQEAIEMYIDTIDDYISNINYKYFGVNNDKANKLKLKEWLEE
ncbi:MAG: hypothetical protein PHR25_00245 [Clostridia bacterium]|nr:hypothetical protein [Clostridia bacterium]